jgi:hypothetical protein
MLSSDYDNLRLQLDYANIQVKLAVLSLWLELDSREQAQANPGESWSSELQNTADSEPQQEIEEDCSQPDMSYDQTSEEEALAPSP